MSHLSNLTAQALRLIDLGVPELAGQPDALFLELAASLPDDGGLLVVHSDLVPASRLAPLLRRGGLPGFVVEDMTDLDDFVPVPSVDVPSQVLYVVHEVDRGDDLLNWTPEEAMAALVERGRTPLTISEGISWLLQQPEQLEPNRCFMCIASRKPKAAGKRAAGSPAYDARTPAIWISGGTGRDGRARRGAPKVGWCWARNRHTWLGFASASHRSPGA